MFQTIYETLFMNAIGPYYMIKESVFNTHKALEKFDPNPQKIVVITGGSRGLGLSVIKHFIKLEYFVILGCRKIEEAKKRLEELENDSAKYLILPLDLQSLESVKSFAEDVRTKASEIEILINNAGIMFTPREETKDGFESQFQTNYLSHFLLTSLLFDKIQKRIVNVSSCAHCMAYLSTNWEDLQKKNFYTPQGSYATSKAAQVLFTKYLQSKIDGSPKYKGNISVFAVHPGMIFTDLYVNTPSLLFKPISGILMKTPEQGAESILHGALSSELDNQGGAYTENSMVTEPAAFSSNLSNQKILWDITLKYLNMDKFAEGLE
uniref:Retinol dehydrogenase 12like [Bombus terrestris] n=1 Tax=Lepeophtheirus salmonis TaxID=72036 RepID=A0A0K2VI86_LEPSM